MPALLTISAAFAFPFLTGVNAFWRMNCDVIQTGRVDPLVNPGTVAAHAHTIVGGSSKQEECSPRICSLTNSCDRHWRKRHRRQSYRFKVQLLRDPS